MIERELGPAAWHGGWHEHGLAERKAFPLGVVGHWPAGNVEIQPILSHDLRVFLVAMRLWYASLAVLST